MPSSAGWFFGVPTARAHQASGQNNSPWKSYHAASTVPRAEGVPQPTCASVLDVWCRPPPGQPKVHAPAVRENMTASNGKQETKVQIAQLTTNGQPSANLPPLPSQCVLGEPVLPVFELSPAAERQWRIQGRQTLLCCLHGSWLRRQAQH